MVGAGNSAFEAALEMNGIARKVYLVTRGDISADQVLRDKVATAKRVKHLKGKLPVEIHGAEEVEALTIADRRSGELRRLAVDAVFVEAGLLPNTSFALDLVETNETGEIIVDERGRTGVRGVFAAGDCTTVPDKQIVVAAGDGAKAALARRSSTWSASADGTRTRVSAPEAPAQAASPLRPLRSSGRYRTSLGDGRPSAKSRTLPSVVRAICSSASLREEALVAGHDDVGEREQARERVVVDQAARVVLVEVPRLLLVHVEPEVADAPRLEPVDHGAGVDEPAAAGVDEHHAGLHAGDAAPVDEVVRLRA